MGRSTSHVGHGIVHIGSAGTGPADGAQHWEHMLPASYADYTVDPKASGVVCAPQPPLPRIQEPWLLPKVTNSRDETLIPITGDRIVAQRVYFDAGWPEAPPFVVARCGVVERLRGAAASLPEGFGLVVLDAWRPLRLQAALHAAAPAGFTRGPIPDPALPAPHLSGGAVDITLSWHDAALSLGTGLDAFVEESRVDVFEQTPGTVRELRRLLYWTLNRADFVVLDREWYHFEHGTSRWAALTGKDGYYAAVTP